MIALHLADEGFFVFDTEADFHAFLTAGGMTYEKHPHFPRYWRVNRRATDEDGAPIISQQGVAGPVRNRP